MPNFHDRKRHINPHTLSYGNLCFFLFKHPYFYHFEWPEPWRPGRRDFRWYLSYLRKTCSGHIQSTLADIDLALLIGYNVTRTLAAFWRLQGVFWMLLNLALFQAHLADVYWALLKPRPNHPIRWDQIWPHPWDQIWPHPNGHSEMLRMLLA